MAEKRMFSKKIINTARFLKMPFSSQLLYFYLGLEADDDGIVEAYPVMRKIGCSEDDLRVLVAKGFVVVLNEDLISYITNWLDNNNIRADRKIDSVYQPLLLSVVPDAVLQEKKENTTKCQPNVNQMSTKCQPSDTIDIDIGIDIGIGRGIDKSIEKEITTEVVKEKEQPQPLRIRLKNQIHYISEEEIRNFQRMYNGTVDVRSEAISCCAYYDKHQCSAASWQVALTKWISRSKLYRQIDTASATENRRDNRRPPLEDKIIEGEDAGL